MLVVEGLPAYRKCPLPLPTPSLPIKAANVSLWLIMRYTSRAVYLQGSETPLCINRAPIHNIGGDVFTNLSMDRDVDIRSKLRVKFSWSWGFWQFVCWYVSQQINITPSYKMAQCQRLLFCCELCYSFVQFHS